MKILNYKKIIFLITSGILVPTMFVFAQPTVKLLEAEAFKDFGSTSSLTGLLTSIFNFGIAAAVVLALIMIIWGGIIKMTTDSWQGQDDAKNKFENAGYGLGLALVSYVILYTINPCLVLFGDKTSCNNTLLFAPTSNEVSKTCVGCVDVSAIGCSNPKSCTLDATLANKLLTGLRGQGARITEAYPPSVEHKSACHYNGTCADVNLINKSTKPANLKILYDSLVNTGLNPVYEVNDPNLCVSYKNVGIKCRATDITGPHFHVDM